MFTDSFYSYTWYDGGSGSSKVTSTPVQLPMNLSSSNRIKARGAIIEAGTFLEFVIEHLLRINQNVFSLVSFDRRIGLNEIKRHTKAATRIRILQNAGVFPNSVARDLRSFARIRKDFAHSYTLVGARWDGHPLRGDDWKIVRPKIQEAYGSLWDEMLRIYTERQYPVLRWALEVIKEKQTKHGLLPISTAFELHGQDINLDLREMDLDTKWV